MPEKSLKETCFWYIAPIAIIAALALCGFIYDRASREYPPPTVHVIVHYQPIEQTHFEQWVGEVAMNELQGKRSQPGKLSPETEHRQAIDMIFRGERSPEMKRGPE